MFVIKLGMFFSRYNNTKVVFHSMISVKLATYSPLSKGILWILGGNAKQFWSRINISSDIVAGIVFNLWCCTLDFPSNIIWFDAYIATIYRFHQANSAFLYLYLRFKRPFFPFFSSLSLSDVDKPCNTFEILIFSWVLLLTKLGKLQSVKAITGLYRSRFIRIIILVQIWAIFIKMIGSTVSSYHRVSQLKVKNLLTKVCIIYLSMTKKKVVLTTFFLYLFFCFLFVNMKNEKERTY